MSSGGVLVASMLEVIEGTWIELAIEWPCLLDGKVPLKLVTSGRVMRSQPFRFAVALQGHQFRTTSRKVMPIDTFRYNAREQTAKQI
jgi:hypothetical protein